MKKLFVSVLAIAAAVACNNSEIVSMDKGEAIQFGNAFVNNSTRADAATDPSYSTSGKGTPLTQFNVYGAVGGVNIFNGDLVRKNDADYGVEWNITSGNKQYWINGANYKFVGVVDGSKKVGGTDITKITPDASGLPATISYTVDGETDLLCDVVTVPTATAPYPLIAFNYTHLLSKIKFSVKNTTSADATNYRFVLTSAKLTNVYKSGVYGVDADTWTPDATMRDYTLENLTINSNSTQYHSQEVLLIPGSAVGVYVEAEIQATDDDPTSADADWKKVSEVEKTFENALGKTGDVANTLAKATAYNFIVELGVGEEIKFTAAEMDEWGNGNTHDSDDADDVKDYVPVQ